MSSIDSAVLSVLAATEGAIQTQVAFALAAKGLEAQRSQGEAVTQLLDAAARQSKAIGKGNHFDTAV